MNLKYEFTLSLKENPIEFSNRYRSVYDSVHLITKSIKETNLINQNKEVYNIKK